MDFFNAPTETLDWAALVAEELEALEGIYGEDITSKRDQNDRVCLVKYKSSQFSATFYIPIGYPSSEANNKLAFEISVSNIPLKNLVLERVNERINSCNSLEEGILFQLIELIKDTIGCSDLAAVDIQIPTSTSNVCVIDNDLGHVSSVDGKSDDNSATSAASQVKVHVASQDQECHDHIAAMIVHGPLVTERRSVFQAHCCTVNSIAEVNMFRSIVLSDKKIASATHNIFAYRFVSDSTLSDGSVGPPVCYHDYDDDGENAAGSRVAELMRLLPVVQCAVIITRWYGGIQLGPDRFKLINNTARNLLDQCGFIEQAQKTDAKSSSRKSLQRSKSSKAKR